MNCSECKNKKHFVYTTCSEFGIFLCWTRNSMNNLLPFFGLVDTKIRASYKDLPVPITSPYISYARFVVILPTKLRRYVLTYNTKERFDYNTFLPLNLS